MEELACGRAGARDGAETKARRRKEGFHARKVKARAATVCRKVLNGGDVISGEERTPGGKGLTS